MDLSTNTPTTVAIHAQSISAANTITHTHTDVRLAAGGTAEIGLEGGTGNERAKSSSAKRAMARTFPSVSFSAC